MAQEPTEDMHIVEAALAGDAEALRDYIALNGDGAVVIHCETPEQALTITAALYEVDEVLHVEHVPHTVDDDPDPVGFWLTVRQLFWDSDGDGWFSSDLPDEADFDLVGGE